MSEEKHTPESNDSSIYYVLGGVVLVAAVAGFFLLKPKDKTAAPVTPTAVSAPVAPGPITKFECGKMYYNPVVGFPKYYVSLEGVDTLTSGNVNCAFTMSVKDKVVGNAQASGPLTEEPSRGGSTFRCTTGAVELAKGVATKVDVKIENANKQSLTCSQTFIFP